MTSKEFIIWLRGFTEGVHEFNITPKQWDLMKEKLAEVNDSTIPVGGVMTDHNTFRTVYPNWTGINPYGTAGPEIPTGTRVTTTPGTTGHITIANPNIASFGSGSCIPSSITYTTSSGLGVGVTYTVPSAWSGDTAYTYPNGTTVTYTAGGANEFDNPKDKTLLHD